MAKNGSGGAAKKEPRLTAARYVSEKYGEKGLRALAAMGSPFRKTLQREIVARRDLQTLLDKKEALEKALADLNAKIEKGHKSVPENPSLPRLEKVIDALPDLHPKKTEEPVEQPEAAEVA